MEASSKKKMNYTMKLMYAFGILFVVSGHVAQKGGISLFYEWFPPYSFHLALFAFCSGYFYKEECETHVCKSIYKKFKKFIIPLYIWNFIYGLFVLGTHQLGFTNGGDFSLYNLLIMPIVHGMRFHYNLGSWFLMSLFLVQVFYLLLRVLSKKNWLNLILCFSLGFLGAYLASHNLNQGLYLTLDRMLFFLPFYAFGHFYQSQLEKRDNMPNRLYFTLILVSYFTILILFKKFPKYTISLCNDFQDGIFLPFAVGFLGVFFWLRICKILEPSLKKSKMILNIANHSFDIMMHQFLGFLLVKAFYAIGYKYFGVFQDFNMKSFKNSLWYYYVPHKDSHFLILYVISGIIVPIAIAKVLAYIKKKIIIKNERKIKNAKQ